MCLSAPLPINTARPVRMENLMPLSDSIDHLQLTPNDHQTLAKSLRIFQSARIYQKPPEMLIHGLFYGTHNSRPWIVFVGGISNHSHPETLDEINNLVWTEPSERSIDDADRCRRTFCYRSDLYTIFFSDQVPSLKSSKAVISHMCQGWPTAQECNDRDAWRRGSTQVEG